ncbi:PREDICTED: mastermind-like protein 2 [Ceratosolen solmsi marchali]|uniref:Mastermind-like protein 2 n=1 Tax=Ceratosolen solmsi marchali TaxID=326594 RepID=A0AAJ6VK39_9HYME|nr:PREDICTED: mastermind-like protein 2 [Ceratosolen solmsi marchali]
MVQMQQQQQQQQQQQKQQQQQQQHGVSFEADGGIRNPACQDEDSPMESRARTNQVQSQQQQQQHLLPSKKIDESCKIHEKRQELQEAMTLCRTRVPWLFSGNLFIGLLAIYKLDRGREETAWGE